MTTHTTPRPFEVVPTRSNSTELWLWPNLLSLQAPVVAVLWQLLLALSLHVKLNPFEPWALGLSVWLIYAADHLIDTVRSPPSAFEPPRKTFCRRHWHKFLLMAFVAGFVLAVLVERFLLPVTVRGGWHLSMAVAGYFTLIHLMPASWRSVWPREIAVAVLFTLGTFGAVWLANGRNLWPMLAAAALFMLLCWMNCSLIETWEWQAGGSFEPDTPNPAARWLAARLGTCGVVIVVASVVLVSIKQLPTAFALASLISGSLLSLLSIHRNEIPPRLVSPAADLALCSPILLLTISRLH